MTPKQALDKAIKKVGTRYALAKGINLSPQAVLKWTRVPPARVLAVEKLTGVSRHDLRPDIYPK